MKAQVRPFEPLETASPDLSPPAASFEATFPVANARYNDLWAAVLFVAAVIAELVVTALALRRYSSARGTAGKGIYDGDENGFGLSTNAMILFILVAGVAAVLGLGHLLLTQRFAKQTIWASGILSTLSSLATGSYYIYLGYRTIGIISLVFAVWYAWSFWTWRSRIPFAVVMLELALEIAREHGRMLFVSAAGGAVAVVLAAWFAVANVAVYVAYTPAANNPACELGGCSHATLVGLLVFTVFAFYWMGEVLKNMLHARGSGVYASWYLCSRTGMPCNPGGGAFHRAITTSFGSICIGSLLVAPLQLLRRIFGIARADPRKERGLILNLVCGIFQSIIRLLDWTAQYLNKYAYSHLALYGGPYFPAAKETWTTMHETECEALLCDCFVHEVMASWCEFVGFLCALMSYLWLVFTHPAYYEAGGFRVVVMVFAFLMGMQVAGVFAVGVDSGVVTVFLALAREPGILRRERPGVWRRIVEVHPQIENVAWEGNL